MAIRRRRILSILAIGLLSLSGRGAPLSGDESLQAQVSPATRAAVFRVAQVLSSWHSGLTEAEIDVIAPVIVAEAGRVGLSTEVVLAVILVESSGKSYSVSRVGALGLMQLRPDTAEAMAARMGERWRGDASLFDPETNIRLGAEYLSHLIGRFGDLPTALAAYNWGPTHIAARVRRGQALPQGYSQRVLTAYQANIPADAT